MPKKVIVFSIGILILGGFIFLIAFFLNFKYLFAGISRCCGNGRLDWGEECDRTVSEADYLNSPYVEDLDGDGDKDSVDYNIMKNACSDECKFACPPSDPHFADINKGCYQPEGSSDPCQKGVWACDYHTGEVKCLDVYSQETERYEDYYIGEQIFDYCCDDYNPTTSPVPPAPIMAKTIRVSSGEGKRCDEVCRENGGVCIGIGQYADMNCEMVTCHTGTHVCEDVNTSTPACSSWGGGGHADTVPAVGMCKDTMGSIGSCLDGSQATKDGDPTNDPSCHYEIFVGGSICYCYIP